MSTGMEKKEIDNAADIFRAKNVDGALVGGASLKADDFAPIIAALAQS